MLTDQIKNVLPSCCEVGYIQLSDCSANEQTLIKGFLSDTKTIIVLFHHVNSTLEWAWYPHEAERNKETCGADLHSKNVLYDITHCLEDDGYLSCIVPYPGICGIRMKDFAEKTGIGQIGDNYLFLHKEWGPWVHLRLLLTNAQFETLPTVKQNVCLHCGKCIKACPSKAIKADSFHGHECRDYQSSQNNGVIDNFYWKCEVCARICPVGKNHTSLQIIGEI